jgi:hypothetical protein
MPTTEPSAFLPLNEARALIHAALVRDIDEIDRITDELVQQGVCRPREDMSRMSEWIARRESGAPAVVDHTAPIITVAGETDIGAQLAAHFRGVFAGAAQ